MSEKAWRPADYPAPEPYIIAYPWKPIRYRDYLGREIEIRELAGPPSVYEPPKGSKKKGALRKAGADRSLMPEKEKLPPNEKGRASALPFRLAGGA